ncbi:YuiB family protein [Bacillus sp. FJAT-52991]|uniref:YuiB family protein n=1 Tax=Bacillus kandeliae TaxID=3129297 RepID=A0ABZ2N536_9BACI
MHIAVVIVSMLLFFVLFFGIGFLLNMLLRMTWVMAFLYPIVTIMIVDEVSTFDYIFNASEAFSALGTKLSSLHAVDITILSSGFLGAITSGIAMRILRQKGYQMF